MYFYKEAIHTSNSKKTTINLFLLNVSVISCIFFCNFNSYFILYPFMPFHVFRYSPSLGISNTLKTDASTSCVDSTAGCDVGVMVIIVAFYMDPKVCIVADKKSMKLNKSDFTNPI